MSVFALILTLTIVLVTAIFLVTGLAGAPYVPTHEKALGEAFTKLYKMDSHDFLIDLGAGDGVVLKAAAKRGAKALGVELNPILTLIMKWRFRGNKRVKVKCCNFYNIKFPEETTVVYAFAVSLHIEPIFRKVQGEAKRLGKPIYFVSNAFDLKDVKPIKKQGSFYLYKA